MVATTHGGRIDEIAQDLLEVVTRLFLVSPRGRRRAGDLKDTEYFTLALLQGRGMMIVGDIQRLLGVLPAQMSRIIRALEGRPAPLVACRINPRDKRKVDVRLTDAGEQALAAYQSARVRQIADLLAGMTAEEQEGLARVLERLRGLAGRGAISGRAGDN